MKPARNSLKGYTYQNYILTLFFAKMDTERNIVRIESEAEGTKQFDDLYIELSNNITYRIQAKNYPGTSLDDIEITGHVVTIKTNQNLFNQDDNNVLVVNTDQIDTDTTFMGLPAVIKSGIVIIPLSEEAIANKLDDMYQNDTRELQIIQKAYDLTCSAKFAITTEDLPPLITFSISLFEETVLLRKVPEEFSKGITHIIGKPGVGKSHYVEEIKTKHNNAIIYRFWIGPQDEQLITRLQYDSFLSQLGIKIFKSPRSFTEESLIEQIVSDDLLLIVDGLDHVENYNPKDMQNYLSFLSKSKSQGARVLVLSRPIKTEIPWDTTELINWNLDETRMYLALAFDITDYSIQKKIYELTDGYPILTRYLAEHYLKYGSLNLEEPILGLNQYYESLLDTISIKSVLCIFATNNSFFTYKELQELTSDPEAYDVLLEFISAYPYLFQIIQNRVSLIHDSLNTYLRSILPSFPRRLEQVNRIVQNSLAAGNVEYMARFSSFIFDERFTNELLIKYSNFSVFKQLLDSTLDFNSLSSFYSQLQRILEHNEGILNIYQYYSFALIFQVVTRNDLIGYDGLMYQILVYMNKHQSIEDNLFSSGIMWHLYLACQDRGDLTQKYMTSTMYGGGQLSELYESVAAELSFFDCIDTAIICEDIVEELRSNEQTQLDKSDLLIKYFVSIWIHGDNNNLFFNEFNDYICTQNDVPLINCLKKNGLDDYWIDRSIRGAGHRLHELGYFAENNKYRVDSLMSVISENAPDGSFLVVQEAQAFIRLANHEQRAIDIFSVNYLWSMYAQRKDYSVHTIDKALLFFEEEGFIDESTSIEILLRLMEQSEKGIRLLLTSYINLKGTTCVDRLIKSNRFKDPYFRVDILDLSAENINRFPKEYIEDRFYALLYSCRHSKTIEIQSIRNILESKYSTYFLEGLHRYNINILGAVDDHLGAKLDAYGIRYIEKAESQHHPNGPFENGYIHEDDFDFIKKLGISAEECAKYADGWYTCLPYVEVFELFNTDSLREQHMHILHCAMFAKVVGREYIGNWHSLIGNILQFARLCNIDLNWRLFFDSFVDFLDVSMIYHPQVEF